MLNELREEIFANQETIKELQEKNKKLELEMAKNLELGLEVNYKKFLVKVCGIILKNDGVFIEIGYYDAEKDLGDGEGDIRLEVRIFELFDTRYKEVDKKIFKKKGK